MMNKNNKPLVIITGPTAVGKTDLSIALAKKIGGEIISADSIQIYKYMDIGSAKIKKNEMQGITHYLVDELDPKEDFNVFKFKEMSKRAIENIYEKGKIPIIVGGTGFYIQSVLYDINFENENDSQRDEIRDKYYKLANEKGNEYVHSLLEEIDKESADAIHFNNLKRVVRALEYYEINHEKFSEHNKRERENDSPYNFSYYVLNRQRDTLYERINKRVDIMINDGLEDEVKRLLDMGYNEKNVSMQGIGYKEMVSYIRGDISLEEAIELIKKNTRNFAKRQLTWFRREKITTFINYENYSSKEDMLDYMLNDLKNKNII